MPRPLRVNVGGAYFHLTTHGTAGRAVLARDEDKLTLLQLLLRTVIRQRWICHAYCVMSTHYHLVLETTEPTLSAGMQVLNGCYARTYNRRYGSKGHVFDARFYSGLIERESHLLSTVRYVARNPVRAGLVSKAQEWPWSSYPVFVGRTAPVPGIVDPRRTLALLDGGQNGLRTIRRFVEDDLFTHS